MPKEIGNPTDAEDTSVDVDQISDDDSTLGDDWDDGDGMDKDNPEYQVESEYESDDTEESDDTANEDDPESEESQDESEEEESEERESEEEDTDSEDDRLEQKRLNDEAAKRRIAERKARMAEDARERDHINRYLEDAKGDEVESARRQNEVDAFYINKAKAEIARERSYILDSNLDIGIQKAVVDLGLTKMDQPTKEFLFRQLDKFEQSSVVRDEYGNLVDVKGDVYQYLKDEMDSIRQFKNIGATDQIKKKNTEQSKTISKSTRTPKEKPSDAGLDAFDEEAERY